MAEETYSFQCKNCGALIPDHHTRDFENFPAVCHVCQHGVTVSDNPHMGMSMVKPDPDNWIVLADLPEGELAKDPKREHLKPGQVVRHVVKRTQDHPRKKVVDNT